MIKVIKFMFWSCVIAGIAFVVRVITTVNGNDISREVINCADGQCYMIDIKFDQNIEDGIKNVLQYHPDAVVVAETRRYANGDILMWTSNGERLYYRYVIHVPVLGRIKWNWSITGQETEVPLREL